MTFEAWVDYNRKIVAKSNKIAWEQREKRSTLSTTVTPTQDAPVQASNREGISLKDLFDEANAEEITGRPVEMDIQDKAGPLLLHELQKHSLDWASELAEFARHLSPGELRTTFMECIQTPVLQVMGGFACIPQVTLLGVIEQELDYDYRPNSEPTDLIPQLGFRHWPMEQLDTKTAWGGVP